jgi:hypothetical protein
MNGKQSKRMRKIIKEEIEMTGAPQENRFWGIITPPKYRFDEIKMKFFKTRKGVPTRYTDDSPRRIYRLMKRAYVRGDV